MRVAFVNNQVDNRGTGNAIYDYAKYNEDILGNKSFIFSLDYRNIDQQMATKLLSRFGNIYSGWDLVTYNFGIDIVYHIKSGEDDGSIALNNVPYVVHAVFNASQPHGDVYATISEWMSDRFRVPYVPHIVRLEEPTKDLRTMLGIPKDAYVFGRHGGPDTFDIDWAWEAIKATLVQNQNLYFIFMGTNIPDTPLDNSRVFFIPPTGNDHDKASFIYACDAMIHARSRGETFGIAVGEFAVAGKPVLTYGASGERAHITQLGGLGYIYYNKEELEKFILVLSHTSPSSLRSSYDEFSPELVMKRFNEVFLNG